VLFGCAGRNTPTHTQCSNLAAVYLCAVSGMRDVLMCLLGALGIPALTSCCKSPSPILSWFWLVALPLGEAGGRIALPRWQSCSLAGGCGAPVAVYGS
jgi:hypothetical protein